MDKIPSRIEDGDDVKVLLKIKGKYYTIEPKPNVDLDWARRTRLMVAALFSDHHTFREIQVKNLDL